jgi:predicted enzyme related to lactoylglutathione lyase
MARVTGVGGVFQRQNESYGRFAWIKDCDGNRVELWRPLE